MTTILMANHPRLAAGTLPSQRTLRSQRTQVSQRTLLSQRTRVSHPVIVESLKRTRVSHPVIVESLKRTLRSLSSPIQLILMPQNAIRQRVVVAVGLEIVVERDPPPPLNP